MGRVRKSGYIIEWFIGDHQPRHVHVYNHRHLFLGRLDIDRLIGIEGWTPDKKLLLVIEELKQTGRL